MNPLDQYDGLFYYPGHSSNLSRWILLEPVQPSSRQAAYITLYSLVQHPQQRGSRIVLCVCQYMQKSKRGGKGKGKEREGEVEEDEVAKMLKRILFPGCIIKLDPAYWRMDISNQLVSFADPTVDHDLAAAHLVLAEGAPRDAGVKILSKDTLQKASIQGFKRLIEKNAVEVGKILIERDQ